MRKKTETLLFFWETLLFPDGVDENWPGGYDGEKRMRERRSLEIVSYDGIDRGRWEGSPVNPPLG
jgi:hypothetical protein